MWTGSAAERVVLPKELALVWIYPAARERLSYRNLGLRPSAQVLLGQLRPGATAPRRAKCGAHTQIPSAPRDQPSRPIYIIDVRPESALNLSRPPISE